jgi:hypothetical protein
MRPIREISEIVGGGCELESSPMSRVDCGMKPSRVDMKDGLMVLPFLSMRLT